MFKYQRCVQRSRTRSHCDATLELNGHLDYLEQLLLARHESLCSTRGREVSKGSESEKENRSAVGGDASSDNDATSR